MTVVLLYKNQKNEQLKVNICIRYQLTLIIETHIWVKNISDFYVVLSHYMRET